MKRMTLVAMVIVMVAFVAMGCNDVGGDTYNSLQSSCDACSCNGGSSDCSDWLIEDGDITVKLADDSPEGVITPGADHSIFSFEVTCPNEEGCTIYEMTFVVEGDNWSLYRFWIEDEYGNPLTEKQDYTVAYPWYKIVFTDNITFQGTKKLSFATKASWGDHPLTEYPSAGFKAVLMSLEASEWVDGLPVEGNAVRSAFTNLGLYYAWLSASPQGYYSAGDNIEMLRFQMATNYGNMPVTGIYLNYNDFDGWLSNCTLYQNGFAVNAQPAMFFDDWNGYWWLNFNPVDWDTIDPQFTYITPVASTFSVSCDVHINSSDQPVQMNLSNANWFADGSGTFFEAAGQTYNMLYGGVLIFQ